MSKLTPEQTTRILYLNRIGLPFQDISLKTGIAVAVVRRCVERSTREPRATARERRDARMGVLARRMRGNGAGRR